MDLTHFSRPSKATKSERGVIRSRLIEGVSVNQLSRDYKISRALVIAIRNNV